jgi:hypothetical protein
MDVDTFILLKGLYKYGLLKSYQVVVFLIPYSAIEAPDALTIALAGYWLPACFS